MGRFCKYLALTLLVLGLSATQSYVGDVSGEPPNARAAVDAADGASPGGTTETPPAAGELLVKFRPQGRFAGSLANKLIGAEEVGHINSLGVTRLRVGESTPLATATRFYEELSLVEYAEPNYVVHAADVPDDPLYATHQRPYYNLIEAAGAWDVESDGASVIVAVLDTGIDVYHPDLQSQVWRNKGEVPANGVDDDGNDCVDDINGCNFVNPDNIDDSCVPGPPVPNNAIEDENGHGTFVAGIIGAATDNGIGVASGAGGVTLLPVKVLDCAGTGTVADVAAGIVYAAEMGASVINLSFGGEEDSFTLHAAVERAHDLMGTVLVSPAGNEGKEGVFFPARYPEVIAVAASGLNSPDDKAIFSNWGPEVDVAAPGVRIVSTVPSALCGMRWVCLNGESYSISSGSSYASAHVSALAALIRSQNPVLAPDDVREVIKSTARPLPDGPTSDWDGAGRIRMNGAVHHVPFSIGIAGVTKS